MRMMRGNGVKGRKVSYICENDEREGSERNKGKGL